MVEVQQQQELRDVLQTAQAALEAGRSQEAVAACQHVLRHFPDAITALRLLGEAYLEAGRSDEAARAFDKALSIDPQNVLARIGLGVIAEDRGEDERAIAQFRLAWEIEPTLPQLRGELVRLYRKRYGAGGRLRLTRVALANLHKRNDDLLRAVAQLRQLHEESPNRPEVTLSLAEALWRQEEDADAAMLCQYLLAERPRTARALLILASIQGDNGVSSEQGVDELLAAVRGLDPDLALTGELIALRPSDTLIAFAEDVPTVPTFDPATAPSGGTDELLSQGVSGKTKPLTRWEDIASGLTSESSGIRSATNMGNIGGALSAAPAPAVDEVDELFAAIDRELALANEHGTGVLPETVPFELPVAAEHEEAADWEHPSDDAMMPDPDEPSAVERLTANWENIDNELAAARPSDDVTFGMTGMLSALGDFDAVPFDVDKASAEEEEVITFDPSKFSLPPLDGEDDDDLAMDLDDAALEDDITPFSLESAGVRTKTSGISFTELVGKQDAPLPSNPGSGPQADAPAASVSSVASIFVTRELSSLPPEQLLELQAGAPDTDALWDTRLLVPATSPIAEAPELAADVPTSVAVEQDDTVVATTHPEAEGVGERGATVARVSSSTSELDKLLSTSAPRLVTPPPTDNYPVDATRPLLADETLMLGVAAATPTAEDHLVSKAPAAPAEDDEVGMDKLFNRLRHRKHERIQTGDLLVNRRLQSSGIPGADTGEIAGPLPEPKKREQRLPGATTVPGAAPTFTEVAGADDAPEAEAIEAAAAFDDALDETAGDTADFLAAIAEDSVSAGATPLPMVESDDAEVLVDDSWLTSLVDDTPDTGPAWGLDEVITLANATPPRGDRVATHASAPPVASAFGAARGETPSRTAPTEIDPDDAPPAGGWAALLDSAPRDEIPEQPAPPDAWSSSSIGEDTPHWGDESLEEIAPLGAVPVAKPPVETVPVRAPSWPAAPVAPARAEPEGVVMRARTGEEPRVPARLASRPLSPTPSPRPAAANALPRQTEQLSKLSALVEAQPDNHFARLTLAVAYVSSQQAEQALSEYRRLIKEAPDLIPEVVERLKEMIADGEAPPRTHRVLGDAYMKLGQFDLAMAEFQRALTARPRAVR